MLGPRIRRPHPSQMGFDPGITNTLRNVLGITRNCLLFDSAAVLRANRNHPPVMGAKAGHYSKRDSVWVFDFPTPLSAPMSQLSGTIGFSPRSKIPSVVKIW